MQAGGIAKVRIIGGHAALDLVNTIGARRIPDGTDYLETYADLLLWADRQGVLEAHEAAGLRVTAAAEPGDAAAALQRAKRLRECLWRIWTALAAGEAPAPPDLALLTREAAASQAARALEWTGRELAWRWTGAAGLDAVTARVALAAAELLPSERFGRVRECAGRNCGWLFLDTTRNGTRLWCSAEECGTLARVTRFRAKRRHAQENGS